MMLDQAPAEMQQFIATLSRFEKQQIEDMAKHYGMKYVFDRWKAGGLQLDVDEARNF